MIISFLKFCYGGQVKEKVLLEEISISKINLDDPICELLIVICA